MKAFILLLSTTIIALFSGCQISSSEKNNSINPILGDISYKIKFGKVPDSETNETLRIKTHLEYVENLLRKKDVSELSSEMREKRKTALDLLKQYRAEGVFPRNYDFSDRVPCFIDKEGRICAVGYLIYKTAGMELAEKINQSHKYDKILAMNSPEVATWVQTSGLTKEECAMIQPTYGWYTQRSVPLGYSVSTGILGGANVAINTLNTIQIANRRGDNTIPLIGLGTGFIQASMGLISLLSSHQFDYNRRLETVSLINMGLGTSTLMLSSINLFTKKEAKEKSYSWNLFGYKTPVNSVACGFTFRKRF